MRSKIDHRSPWFILFIVLVASVAAPLNQFKVPPVLPLLMDAFRLPAGRAGLLMSVFAITGIILAIPAGFIFQRLGPRRSGLIAILSLVIGSAWGALSAGMGTLLASRLIEGIGMSFMTVAAPAIIAISFASRQRGKAMGIWATWVPLGSLVMLMAAPIVAGRWGWKGVWWSGCLYTVLVGLLYFLFIKPPPVQRGDESAKVLQENPTGHDIAGVLRNRELWLIALLFCCFNFVFVAFVTWTPTFLHEAGGRSLASSSLLVSVAPLFSLVAGPVSGWVSDKTGSRKLICVAPMFLMMALLPLVFVLKEGGLLPVVIAIGCMVGFVPTGIFSAGAEVIKDPRLSGMAMAVIQIGQNAGMLLGPFVFGRIVESMGGWQMAFWILAPVSALGATAAWIAKMR